MIGKQICLVFILTAFSLKARGDGDTNSTDIETNSMDSKTNSTDVETNSTDAKTYSMDSETTSFTRKYGTDICTLRPLDFGVYLGVNKVNYAKAVECCSSKDLMIPFVHERVKIRYPIWDAMIAAMYRTGADPIGRDNMLFVQDEDNNQTCLGISILSLHNSTLIAHRINCSESHGFLCVSKYFPMYMPGCDEIIYKNLDGRDVAYSEEKLSWRDAVHCCESRGQQLISLTTPMKKKVQPLIGSLDMPIWTSGHKNVGSRIYFEWLNRRPLVHVKEDSEFCLAADATSTLTDTACEKQLNFICVTEPSSLCASTKWIPLFNEGSSDIGNYTYIENSMMTWGEAADCCTQMGLRLLSAMGPGEGALLAQMLQRQPKTKDKYRTILKGLWNGARRTLDNKFRFAFVQDKPSMFFNPNYLRRIKGNGNCMTIIVGARNSFLRHDVHCMAKRPFVCAHPALPKYKGDDAPFIDIDNHYFYSKTPATFQQADAWCAQLEMKLSPVTMDPEESQMVFHSIRTLAFNVTGPGKSKQNGFWYGHNHGQMTVKTNNHEWFPHEQLTTTTEEADFDRLPRTNPEDIKSHSEVAQNMVALSNQKQEDKCNFLRFVGNMAKEDTIVCSLKAHFLCEETISIGSHMDCGGFTPVRPDVILSTKPASWFEAEKCCRFQNYSQLVSLDPEEDHYDHDQLVEDFKINFNIVKDGFWTSGTNVAGTGGFFWMSGKFRYISQPIFYRNYFLPEQESMMESKQCLEAFFDEGTQAMRISHDDCDKPRKYYCTSKYVTKNLESCEILKYDQVGKSDFYMSQSVMAWSRASQCCQARNATLAKVQSTRDSIFLKSQLRRRYGGRFDSPRQGFWIGLTRGIMSDHMTWLNEDEEFDLEVYYHNFINTTAAQHDQGCVGMFTQGDGDNVFWDVFDCSDELRALCEMDGDKNFEESSEET